MRTVAFCEIEPFCRAVLRKHWPGVPIFEDVRTLTARDVGAVDVICGGFPCQDISFAGKGAGLSGERSGLWREYERLIGEARPRYAIIENVSALRSRGLDVVLGSLTALGYDAEWHCIPASAVGAPHRRDRVWITAYRNADSDSKSIVPVDAEASELRADVADANTLGAHGAGTCSAGRIESSDGCDDVSNADSNDGRQGRAGRSDSSGARQFQPERALQISNANSEPPRRLAIAWGECSQWITEPDVGRVANGIPSRVDRLKSLGNAVVPQIPEIIGRAIMRAEGLAA